ncbi:MAG: DNA translocase FtsK [bacterium]
MRGAWAFGLLTVLLIAAVIALVHLWKNLSDGGTARQHSEEKPNPAKDTVLTLPAPAAAYAGPGTPTARRREEALKTETLPTEAAPDEATRDDAAFDAPEPSDETDTAEAEYLDPAFSYAQSRLGIAWPDGRTRVRFDDDDTFADDVDETLDAVAHEELVVHYRDGAFLSDGGGEESAEADLLDSVDETDDLVVHMGFEADEAGESDEEEPEDEESSDLLPPDSWEAEFWEAAEEDSTRPVEEAAPVVRTPARKKRGRRYHVPIEGLLDEYPDKHYWEIDQKTRDAAETLRVTLAEFGIEAEVTGIRRGPVITMFEILPARGVKLTKIVNLADNIALRLAAQTVRIVAPIPGKHAVGIEVPNHDRAIVSFGDLIQEKEFKDGSQDIPLAIGKDIPGDAQIIDLTKTPHLLIAGATGSGKSVCVNSIICSILYRRSPEEVKMVMIDPKIVELKFYNDIPHLLTPVITEPKKAFQALQWCLYEMERRYQLLDKLQVRDLKSYNRRIEQRELATEKLPYIVVIVDEFADLMATSGKELEQTLARLAAMSRAVGIHLVLATQRPSTDVITGLIKANIPSRIAFMVSSKVDSRIILDGQGAEKLLGRGDMLLTSAWDPAPNRIQGAFLSDEEIERVVQHVRTLGEPDYIDDEIFIDDEDDFVQEELEDPLMEKAIQIVQTSRKASASYLQRRLKIGYNRAARMVEEMERVGIVGPQNGSKPREILMNV